MNKYKRIEELLAEVKRITGELEELKSPAAKFEIGKWYKHNDSLAMFNYQERKNITESGSCIGFGFDATYTWTDKFWLYNTSEKHYFPATEQEIKDALLKEAKKRGFVKGAKFEVSAIFGTSCDYIVDGDFFFSEILNHLRVRAKGGLGLATVYKDGKWAKIIEKSPALTFGGHEVVVSELSPREIVITCKGETGTYEQLKAIYNELSSPPEFKFGGVKPESVKTSGGTTLRFIGYDAKEVKIGCVWGTMGEIKAILDYCESLGGTAISNCKFFSDNTSD